MLLIGLVVIAKVGVAYLLARLSHLVARPMQLAIGLGQIGEFSFVLAALGLASGQLDRPIYTAILAAVALSIAVSTVVVRIPRAVPARSSTVVASG
jgi:CPA2 family monovalent cation:H+ antiporter-2